VEKPPLTSVDTNSYQKSDDTNENHSQLTHAVLFFYAHSPSVGGWEKRQVILYPFQNYIGPLFVRADTKN